MKTIKQTLNAEQIEAKLVQLKANLALVDGNTSLQSIADDFKTEIASLEELQGKLAGVDKVAEFNTLFTGVEVLFIEGENVNALTPEQVRFIGEGITVKLTADGKLALVKKSGGSNGLGGPKASTPYSEYITPFTVTQEEGKPAVVTDNTPQVHATAASAVNASVAFLAKNGKQIKVSTGNSMRREMVTLNKNNNLGVKVKDIETSEIYDLLTSKHETTRVPSGETATAESETAE